MTAQKQSIEQSLQELEKIVEDLHARDVDVEEGLKKFKDGVALIHYCRRELGQAENEFKKLQAELEQNAESED
jgi:exodeoxyribonuclease VII small subunit